MDPLQRQELLELRRQELLEFHSKQAIHNSKLANKLFLESSGSDEPFFDWVITVSFYSSLHYVTAILCKLQQFLFLGKLFQGILFDEFYEKCKKGKFSLPEDPPHNKHECMKVIVEYTFPSISSAYTSLFDRAHTSRYKQYKDASEKSAEEALNKLRQIEVWYKETIN